MTTCRECRSEYTGDYQAGEFVGDGGLPRWTARVSDKITKIRDADQVDYGPDIALAAARTAAALDAAGDLGKMNEAVGAALSVSLDYAQKAGVEKEELIDDVAKALEVRDPDIIADGSGCYYCAGSTDYHPICDRPGCGNLTHGYGSDGRTTRSYCGPCRGAVATDGGSPSAAGERGPPPREDTDTTVSPGAFRALESRVSALEDRVKSQQQTITDLVAMVNDSQDDLRELEERVDEGIAMSSRQSNLAESQQKKLSEVEEVARPHDCDCGPDLARVGMSCWPCYRDGFEAPNPEEVDDDA
jgi:uncharacterized coiled-coil protein SlyX